jgi:hypothetical protein
MPRNNWCEFTVCIPLTLTDKRNHLLREILEDVLIVPELLTQHSQSNKTSTGPHGASLDIFMEGLK